MYVGEAHPIPHSTTKTHFNPPSPKKSTSSLLRTPPKMSAVRITRGGSLAPLAAAPLPAAGPVPPPFAAAASLLRMDMAGASATGSTPKRFRLKKGGTAS
jgi:hypothetical protein